MHPAAQQVLDALVTTSGGGQPVTTEAKETINMVVPLDMSPEEIAQMKRRLTAPGTEPMNIEDAVISALQEVRPGGEKAQAPMQGPEQAPMQGPAPPKNKAAHEKPHKPAIKAVPKPAKNAAPTDGHTSTVVDPVPTFRGLIQVAPNGRVSLPGEITFNGVSVTITSVVSRILLTVEDDEPEVEVRFRVVHSWPGATLPNGTLLKDGQDAVVQFPKSPSTPSSR